MDNLISILIHSVNMTFDSAGMLFAALSDGTLFAANGSEILLASALITVTKNKITEGVRSSMRKWYGNISNQLSSIENLVKLIDEHKQEWQTPPDLLEQLTTSQTELQTLIDKCRTTSASAMDRQARNVLLKSTVSLCRIQAKAWILGQFSAGIIMPEDVHRLGFLLPGEIGGRRKRHGPTDALAEVKVKVINADFIRVVIDRSTGANAAQVTHGWPTGVRNALIIILSTDKVTEVHRQMTTRLHTGILMPKGSHGRLFIIKAAFLRHVDDIPCFGSEATFSLPLTTEDLIIAPDSQSDAQNLAIKIERQRLEIERLNALLNQSGKL
jgi:hypothetical protein